MGRNAPFVQPLASSSLEAMDFVRGKELVELLTMLESWSSFTNSSLHNMARR